MGLTRNLDVPKSGQSCPTHLLTARKRVFLARTLTPTVVRSHNRLHLLFCEDLQLLQKPSSSEKDPSHQVHQVQPTWLCSCSVNAPDGRTEVIEARWGSAANQRSQCHLVPPFEKGSTRLYALIVSQPSLFPMGFHPSILSAPVPGIQSGAQLGCCYRPVGDYNALPMHSVASLLSLPSGVLSRVFDDSRPP